jgi:hypothetical protein
MNSTENQYVQLARACAVQADRLAQIQQNEHYQGPNIAALYANEMALRTKVLLLNTAAVETALAHNDVAQTQLQNAIASANGAAQTIASVQKAIGIAADLIALAAGVMSENPGAVIEAATKLISDASAATSPT